MTSRGLMAAGGGLLTLVGVWLASDSQMVSKYTHRFFAATILGGRLHPRWHPRGGAPGEPQACMGGRRIT